MKKKKSKKIKSKSNIKNQELGQTKNSAKLILFIFGIGPIIVRDFLIRQIYNSFEFKTKQK